MIDLFYIFRSNSGVAKDQYKLRLEEDLVQRLTEISQRFGWNSGNEVAADVIGRYLDFWVAAQEQALETYEAQRAQTLGGLGKAHAAQPRSGARKKA